MVSANILRTHAGSRWPGAPEAHSTSGEIMNAQWIDRFSSTKNWVRALAATSVVTLGMLGISANPANAATVPFNRRWRAP
jgi:hypothetical protein